MRWRLKLMLRRINTALRQSRDAVLSLPMRLSVRTHQLLTANRAGRAKRVLLLAANELMARWLIMQIHDLRDDRRIAFTFAVDDPDVASPLNQFCRDTNLPSIAFAQARLRDWDLALTADHHHQHLHPAIPLVYTGHGTTASKIVDGRIYQYSPTFILREDGEPRYARFFVASETARDTATRECPQLAGRIEIVGDVQGDQLLTRSEQRGEIRHRLGLKPEDKVVLIMSTWGPASLMESMGPAIIEAAKPLAGDYRFLFSTHPNHWRGDSPAARQWREEMIPAIQRFASIITPEDDSLDALVAADMAISDHTSLASTYAMLGKPLAMIPIAEGKVAPGTVAARLHEAVPHLSDAGALAALLLNLPAQHQGEEIARILSTLNSKPGLATRNIAEVVRQMLALTAATNSASTGSTAAPFSAKPFAI